MSALLTGAAPAALLAGLAVLVLLLPSDGRSRLRRLASPPSQPLLARRSTPAGAARDTGAGRALPAAVRAGAPVGAPVVGPVVAAGAAGSLALLGLGPAAALVAAAAVLAVPAAVRRSRRDREEREERAGALEACAALAAELRAGRPPLDALQLAADVAHGPFRARLLAAASAARLGGDAASALVAGPEPGTRPTAVPSVAAGLAACWRVCGDTGAGLAAAVDRLEEGLRAAEAARRAVDAELAGPRSTALLLAALPLAGLGLAAALGARPLEVLLGSPLGGACLVLGVALDLAGLAWTRRLARAAELVA